MFNKKYLVDSQISIIEALRRLDETAGKALLVVDIEDHLMGTVTDGDIRRYLLNGRSLEDNIIGVYKRDPIRLTRDNYSEEKAKAIFLEYKISLLPIIDKDNRVIDVISWDRAFSDEDLGGKRKIRAINVPVVIMAGGRGTRLDPFTKILPKPLIPIGDKPIIELIMDRFHESGMKDFYVTLNHKSKMIKAYFEEFKTKYRIKYIDEKQPLGTAGGLRYLPDNLTGPVFVSNSDIIIEEDYRKILRFHRQNRNEITIVASVKNYNIPYGVCEIDNGGILKKISEKPSFNFLINTGMYVVNSGVMGMIPEGKHYHITELIEDAKSSGLRIGVFPISEKSWIDIGEWENYKKALEHFKA